MLHWRGSSIIETLKLADMLQIDESLSVGLLLGFAIRQCVTINTSFNVDHSETCPPRKKKKLRGAKTTRKPIDSLQTIGLQWLQR